jgi:hypothetical protein
MSLKRWAARRDANEEPIVQALRRCGAEVWFISGAGAPDLLVKYRNRIYAGEVKTATGKLRASQGAFPVWRTPDEALREIGAIR